MDVHLVCEGPENGLDKRLLDSLVIQGYNLFVEMAPSGGSGSLGAVRVYLTSRSNSDVAISVQDQDYHRTRAEADASWANLAAKKYIWRRHEIENYLLHPRVILTLFDDYRGRFSWSTSLPSSEPDVLAFLQEIAVPLLENHAGELLRVELQSIATMSGNLKFGALKPPVSSGANHPDEAGWIAALQQESARLCSACSSTAVHPALEPAAIATRYQTMLSQFKDPAFLNSEGFLIEMGGHELIAALAGYLRRIGAPPKLTTLLEDELLAVLSRIYQPGLYQPDDFQELATILRQYVP